MKLHFSLAQKWSIRPVSICLCLLFVSGAYKRQDRAYVNVTFKRQAISSSEHPPEISTIKCESKGIWMNRNQVCRTWLTAGGTLHRARSLSSCRMLKLDTPMLFTFPEAFRTSIPCNTQWYESLFYCRLKAGGNTQIQMQTERVNVLLPSIHRHNLCQRSESFHPSLGKALHLFSRERYIKTRI